MAREGAPPGGGPGAGELRPCRQTLPRQAVAARHRDGPSSMANMQAHVSRPHGRTHRPSRRPPEAGLAVRREGGWVVGGKGVGASWGRGGGMGWRAGCGKGVGGVGGRVWCVGRRAGGGKCGGRGVAVWASPLGTEVSHSLVRGRARDLATCVTPAVGTEAFERRPCRAGTGLGRAGSSGGRGAARCASWSPHLPLSPFHATRPPHKPSPTPRHAPPPHPDTTPPPPCLTSATSTSGPAPSTARPWPCSAATGASTATPVRWGLEKGGFLYLLRTLCSAGGGGGVCAGGWGGAGGRGARHSPGRAGGLRVGPDPRQSGGLKTSGAGRLSVSALGGETAVPEPPRGRAGHRWPHVGFQRLTWRLPLPASALRHSPPNA